MKALRLTVWGLIMLGASSCADNTVHRVTDNAASSDGDAVAADNDATELDEATGDKDGTTPDLPADIDTARPDADTLDSVCVEHWDCSEGMFCRRNIGACADPGTCDLMPFQCDEIWAPVCGCDGLTYPNECSANRGGHNVAYDGECQPGPSCLDTSDCGEGTFCLPPGGMCGAQGTCQPYPDNECPPVTEIVCGCDGANYANGCLARLNGTGIAHAGPCGSMIACTTNKQCTETEYCAKSVGDCGETEAGKCDLRPLDCAAISALLLVCGCDGLTYDHPCFAAAAGVGLLHEGACDGQNVCLGNKDCGETEFCKKDMGVCEKGSGACETKPDACPLKAPGTEPTFGEPICGCDGLTYTDECTANTVGMNVDFAGTCEDAIPKSSLAYSYRADDSPQVTAHIFAAIDAEETIEYGEATVVEKDNTDITDIILRVTYGNVMNPVPGQENIIVQLHLPRIANVPYAVTVDGVGNYVRWLDAVGNTKVDLLGTVTITLYQTDNDFPDYTLTGLDFFGEGLVPKQ